MGRDLAKGQDLVGSNQAGTVEMPVSGEQQQCEHEVSLLIFWEWQQWDAEGSDCRLQSVSLCGSKSGYVKALFAPCSSVRQTLSFVSPLMWWSSLHTCSGVMCMLGCILMSTWTPKADETERMHIGAAHFCPGSREAWLYFHKSFVVARKLLGWYWVSCFGAYAQMCTQMYILAVSHLV